MRENEKKNHFELLKDQIIAFWKIRKMSLLSRVVCATSKRVGFRDELIKRTFLTTPPSSLESKFMAVLSLNE